MSKNVLTSKIVLTNLVSLGVMLAATWGFDVSPELQTKIVTSTLTIVNVLSMVFRFYSGTPVHVKKPKEG